MYRDAFTELRLHEDEIRRIVVANAREREAREGTARASAAPEPAGRPTFTSGDAVRWLRAVVSGVSGLVRPLGL